LVIFRFNPRYRMDPTMIGHRPKDPWRTLPLVCKGWYGAATRVLYEVVEFPTVGNVFLFHRSLKERPHLRNLVRTLILPGRVGVPCPDKMTKSCIQVINLLGDNLQELHTMCHIIEETRMGGAVTHPVLPIPIGTHATLTSLELFADSRGLAHLPDILDLRLENLQSLVLHGFILLSTPNMRTILPNLTSFGLVRCRAIPNYLDWLCLQPKLNRLVLKKSSLFNQLGTTPEILSGNRKVQIRSLDLDLGSLGPNWLQRAQPLRHLIISHRAFIALEVYPPELETLTLYIRGALVTPVIVPSRDEFTKFAENEVLHRLRRFSIEVCKHQLAVVQSKEWLRELFRRDGLELVINDEVACRCPRSCSRFFSSERC
jgi:hypothetical protein